MFSKKAISVRLVVLMLVHLYIGLLPIQTLFATGNATVQAETKDSKIRVSFQVKTPRLVNQKGEVESICLKINNEIIALKFINQLEDRQQYYGSVSLKNKNTYTYRYTVCSNPNRYFEEKERSIVIHKNKTQKDTITKFANAYYAQMSTSLSVDPMKGERVYLKEETEICKKYITTYTSRTIGNITSLVPTTNCSEYESHSYPLGLFHKKNSIWSSYLIGAEKGNSYSYQVLIPSEKSNTILIEKNKTHTFGKYMSFYDSDVVFEK